jgi:glycosyltransferase involved in cell wall biosynthesis
MMEARLLTALILTYNEEDNIERTLDSLRWLPNVLIIDSGSTDRTLEMISRHPGAMVLHRRFDSFAEQCNFGLSKIQTPWVLSLDADYRIPPELAEEILTLIKQNGDADGATFSAFRIPFRYCIAGKPLRSTLLPPRTCLYRHAGAFYRNDGHGHRVVTQGPIGQLRAPLWHDDRKPLERWLSSQQSYMRIEAAKLRATPNRELSAADRLRKNTSLAPLAALLMCLLWKGGVWDGWRGGAYALQRAYAELLLRLYLLEDRIQATGRGSASP